MVKRHPGWSPAAGRALAIVVIGFLAPTRLPAQDLRSLLDRSSYAQPQQEAVRGIFERAQAEGVPADLLLPRLQEGLAKRVGAGRMVQALERELTQLNQARALLVETEGGPRLLQDSASWARTANLLAAGMAETEVRQLIGLWRTRWPDYRPATGLYAALLHWGLSRPEAWSLIEALQASALPAESFAGIQDILMEGRRLRLKPEDLVERMRQRMPQARSMEKLKEEVLHDRMGG